MAAVGYEAFYGLAERPFSLTPDPKYFFRSASHRRALEMVTFGLRRRDPFLIVTGDLGLGKTTFCSTLVEQLRRRTPVAYLPNPLVQPVEMWRLLLEDVGAISARQIGSIRDLSARELSETFSRFMGATGGQAQGVVLVIDEAQRMPADIVAELLTVSTIQTDGRPLIQVVLVGLPPAGDPGVLGIPDLDRIAATRARLLPLGRDECASYAAHRLMLAGGSTVTFSRRAIDTLCDISGGIPRLINLICDRALQEAASRESAKIEFATIEAAASALELLRARPKRFRWFHARPAN
jgi:general secretion pathway protein A